MEYKQDNKGRFVKVGAIIWTIDPENNPRFLIRHNKPFSGYNDEWTIIFGNVEEREDEKEAVLREAREEFGLKKVSYEVVNLDYEIEFEGKQGKTVIHFYAVRIPNVDTKIVINKESIGYDWMLLDKVKGVMQYEDEKKAFDILVTNYLPTSGK